MTDVSVKWKYRVSSHNGMLYVRESQSGVIVARIPSDLSTRAASTASDVVTACTSHFWGIVESVSHDEDVLHVTCKIPVK